MEQLKVFMIVFQIKIAKKTFILNFDSQKNMSHNKNQTKITTLI